MMLRRVKRIRGLTLQKRRRRLFVRQPLCVACLAKQPSVTRLADERDHRVPLHQGGTEREDNEQALCSECHLEKSKTERGQRYKPRRRIGADGYPVALTNEEEDARC